jgi:DNA-binding NarL/FixJ family response regulator
MKNIIRILVTSANNEDCSRILKILSTQDDFDITGSAKDEYETIIKSESLQPDVLILDIQLQGISEEHLASVIHRKSPSTAIIMLNDRDDENYACLALKAGISGYLHKEKDIDKLTSAVKAVFWGGYYISASIIFKVFNTAALISQFPGQINGQSERNFFTFLSAAERGIVSDLAQGYSDLEIAQHLHFSTGTIKNYLSSIKRKTKLKNRIQIVIFSLIYGFIRLEQLDIWKTNRQFTNDTIQ